MDTVPIVVNGEPRRVPPATTVADLLAQLGRHPRSVAVEHNGEILPRHAWGSTVLAANDRVEIVGFVQGG